MTVLTLDLGTSATKACLWSEHRLLAIARSPIATSHPSAGRAEQDPEDWWRSVSDACAALRDEEPAAFDAIDLLGCSAARETFACFDSDLRAIGAGLLWSDARALDEARDLGDPIEFRRRTGVILAPSCCAAKIRWVQTHEPTWFNSARWLLSPRDFILGRLTGHVATDPSLASRTGIYHLDGTFGGDETVATRMPTIISSLQSEPVAHGHLLGLPHGTRAILGAGDRACEVLGVGATAEMPMVSWGTTANVSVPCSCPVNELPTKAQVSRSAVDGFLIEAGLSAAGAALDWLGSLTGRSATELLVEAERVDPGAGGLFAFPWLHGARAPWWRPNVNASFIGLSTAHGEAELARSIIEGIAFDVARCIDLFPGHTQALAVAGRGARDPLWRSVVAAATGRPVMRRALTEAGSVGARILVAISEGAPIGVDELNPMTETEQPDPELVKRYAALRERSDRLAETVIGLE